MWSYVMVKTLNFFDRIITQFTNAGLLTSITATVMWIVSALIVITMEVYAVELTSRESFLALTATFHDLVVVHAAMPPS